MIGPRERKRPALGPGSDRAKTKNRVPAVEELLTVPGGRELANMRAHESRMIADGDSRLSALAAPFASRCARAIGLIQPATKQEGSHRGRPAAPISTAP
jgi:hypothetical protein